MLLIFKIKNATGKPLEHCNVSISLTTGQNYGGHKPNEVVKTVDVGTINHTVGQHSKECHLKIDKDDYREIFRLNVSVKCIRNGEEYNLNFSEYDIEDMEYLPTKYTIVFDKYGRGECKQTEYIRKCFEIGAVMDATKVWVIKRYKSN